jgi:hypothetical protein
MKTFQQFQEDARSAGVDTRRALDTGARAVGDFTRGLFTRKHGTKKGSAQDWGARTQKTLQTGVDAVDSFLKTSNRVKNQATDAAIKGTIDFTKGLVTGKKK